MNVRRLFNSVMLGFKKQNTQNLWLCGQFKNVETKEWEVQGIFDSEQKAIAACRTHMYFIIPLTLNESLSHDTESAKGYYLVQA